MKKMVPFCVMYDCFFSVRTVGARTLVEGMNLLFVFQRDSRLTQRYLLF